MLKTNKVVKLIATRNELEFLAESRRKKVTNKPELNSTILESNSKTRNKRRIHLKL